MKSAYELAMERLEKESPEVKVTEEQKAELAELDNLYQSKLAEREVFLGGIAIATQSVTDEVFLGGKIAEAEAAGDFEALEQLQKQLASDRKTLEAELEEKKEAVRGK